MAKRVLDKTPYMAQRIEPAKRNGMLAGAGTSRTNPAIGATMPRGGSKGRGEGVPPARTTVTKLNRKFVLVVRSDLEAAISALSAVPPESFVVEFGPFKEPTLLDVPDLLRALRQALRDG